MKNSTPLTIDEALLLVIENLKKTLYSTENEYLKSILEYFFSNTGKELRPILVLFSAAISGGITERSIRAAELVSLLHSATLIHDDIIDDAKIRRNISTVNTKWNNSLAVLLGDYVFAHLVEKAILNKDYDFLQIISYTIKNMIEGEFLQQKNKNTYNPLKSEENSELISYQKTACFFESCCTLGSFSTENTKELKTLKNIKELKTLKNIGKNIGMAFQLKDDIIDYEIQDNGKGYGNDFKSGIMTLPLIYSLKNASSLDHSTLLREFGNPELTNKGFIKIAKLIEKNNGIIDTKLKLRKYEEHAKLNLENLNNAIHKELNLLFLEKYFINK